MEFSKELSIGNRVLDSEHRKLHSIINDIIRLMAARDVAAIWAAFELLENTLCAYFAIEEEIAQAINFDFSKHQLAHQKLLGEFKRIKDELRASDGMWHRFEEKGYIDSLKTCLLKHIKEDAQSLKILLETNFYDFKPN